jgi:hypothetical protein
MWYDEAYTFCFTNASWLEFLETIKRLDIGIAFYYLALRCWAMLAGDSQISLRLFSAFFAIASIAAIYLLSREFFSHRVALFSAILLVSNAFWFEQGQTARVYSLALFLSIVASICYARMLRSPGISRWTAAYSIIALVLTASQYAVGLTLFVGHCMSFLVMDRRIMAARVYIAVTIPLAVCIFLAGLVIANLGTTLIHTPMPVTLQSVWQQLSLLFGRKFALVVVGLLVFSSMILSFRKSDGRLISLTIWTVVPIIAILTLSLSNSAALGARYMIAALGPFLILASYGIECFIRSKYTFAVLGLSMAAELAGLAAYFAEPWQDFDHKVRFLSTEMRPADSVVFSPPYLAVRVFAALHYDRIDLPADSHTVPTPLSEAWRVVDQQARTAEVKYIPSDRRGTLWVVTYEDELGTDRCSILDSDSLALKWARIESVCILQQ